MHAAIENTFARLRDFWLKEVREQLYDSETVQIMVLGNKCDLVESRQVSTERGRMFAEEHELQFMEISAKIGENVEKVLRILAKNAADRNSSNQPLPDNQLSCQML